MQIFNNTSTKIFLKNSSPEDQKIIVNFLGTADIKEYTINNKIGDVEQVHNLNQTIKNKKIVLESELANLPIKKTKHGLQFSGIAKIGTYDPVKFSYETQDFYNLFKLEEREERRGFSQIKKVEKSKVQLSNNEQQKKINFEL